MQFNNKSLFRVTLLLAFLCLVFYVPGNVSACTIGVASGGATADGRPMLWKSRDVTNYNQEFHYYDDGQHIPFISVTYSGETEKYYGGVNAAGFALGNSDSYNLGGSSGYDDGRIHKQALLTCLTVDDFQDILDSLIQQVGGLELNSNYGVIDAFGGAAMFECATYSYTRYNASEQGGFIVRANYSYSGDMSSQEDLVGWGLFRHDRAYSLWNDAVTAEGGTILTPQYVYRHVVRDLAIEGTDPYPLPFEGQIGEYPYGGIPNTQAICRYKTRSVVVVQGVPNNEDPDDAILWAMCGNPLATVPLPLWVRAGSVPVEFDGNDVSLICNRGVQLADWVNDIVGEVSVVNTWKLTNPQGNGLWDDVFPWSDWVFDEVNTFTNSVDFSYDDLEVFQNDMATLTYDDLMDWQPSCPEWTSVPETVTGDESTLIEFNVSGISSYNEALTITFNPDVLPGAAQFTDNGDGTGSFSWQTTFDDAGNYTPIFTLSDGALTADASVSITVNGVNRAPEWTSYPDAVTGDEGSAIEFSVAGIDPDSDNLTITYSGDGIPPECLTDNGDGTATFSWLTAEGDAGDYTATFTISDGSLTDVAAVSIHVSAPGPGEAFASSESTSSGSVQGNYTNTVDSDDSYEILTEVSSTNNPAKRRYSLLEHVWTFEITGSSLELHAEAYRSANDEGDNFILAGSFDGQNYTDLITVNSDNEAGYSAQIDGNATGNYYVKVTDTDHTAANLSLDSFHLDMLSITYMTGAIPNQPPEWTDVPGEVTGYPDTEIAFSVTGTDPENDNITITLTGEGNLNATGNGTADYTWTPTELGDFTATFTISDGEFDVDAVVNISVVDQPEPGTMIVSAIDLSENVINRNFSTCVGVITVVDPTDDTAVSGAVVSATWSDLYSADVQGTTDENGHVTFQTGNVRNPDGLFTLTITNVTKADWTYDENENIVTTASLGVGTAGNGGLTLDFGAPIPEEVVLNPAYPNPFNDYTTIRFGLPEDGKVRVTVYDLLGKRVTILTSSNYNAGWHSVAWNPRLLANGKYIVRLESGKSAKTGYIVFIK